MSIDIENIIQYLKMTELYDHDLSCAIEALEQQQEEIERLSNLVCRSCNGYGIVGNMLDSDTCPECKGNGIEEIKARNEVIEELYNEFYEMKVFNRKGEVVTMQNSFSPSIQKAQKLLKLKGDENGK